MVWKMKRILCQVKPTDAFSSFPIFKDKIPILTCSLAPLQLLHSLGYQSPPSASDPSLGLKRENA